MTNEELADALESKAKWDTPHEQTFLREAAQRLRAMPEGERIEVNIGERKVTLILHTRKEGESDESN